ncbi:MAG: D-galactonate dehydratase family protein [Armatimonas sp.]
MKITAVDVFLTCPGRNYVFVKVRTDIEGLYGVGEGTLNGSEPIVAEAIRHMSHLIIGRDPRRIEDTWMLLYRQGYWRGGPIFMAAIAAIDLALWDIKGKLANMPVYELFGGAARDGVRCYTHASGRDEVECEDSARKIIEEGFTVVRCQVGAYGGAGIQGMRPAVNPVAPKEQIYEPTKYLLSVPKMFAHMRDKLGEEIELMHDVHEQLDPIAAARLAKSVEEYRLFLLEDPLMPEHRESWPLVRAASNTPLAIGEILTSRWDCLPLFQNRWIDFIRIKPLHVGGLTEARKILTLAEPYNVRSAFHGAGDIGPIAQAASVHLQTVIPNFGVQEWCKYPEPVYDMVSGICERRGGFVYASERPGLGIDFDETKCENYPYERAYMPLVRRADGTMHVY